MQTEIRGKHNFDFVLKKISLHKTEWILTLLFFILSLIGVLYHEIWLDEAQHYLLARDSKSISDLIYNCRMEGHPLLWNLLLFFITRFSQEVVYMQLLHIIINCCTVYLIAGTRLKLFEKICIIFSYFIFYEYNIISRNYGLATLMMLFVGIGYFNKSIKLIPLSIAFVVLANTHLYGLLFSVAFIACLLIYDRKYLFNNKNHLLLASVIYIFGMLIALVTIVPPNNYTHLFIQYENSGFLSTDRILKTLSVCLKGIFYLPDFSKSGSGIENSSYIFEHINSTLILLCISLIAIAIPAFLFRKNKFALVLFISYFIFYSVCNYFLPLINGTRYFGFFYIVFVICYIISRVNMNRWEKIFATGIFLLQMFNGIYFYITDLNKQFSVTKTASSYLSRQFDEDARILILDRTIRPSISAYTKRKYFGIETGTPRSWCLWQNELTPDESKIKIDSVLQSNQQTLIITGQRLPDYIDSTKIELIKQFDNSMLKNENLVIYKFNRTEK